MEKDSAGEGRLRRYAQAFRREANPPADLATSLVTRLTTRGSSSRFGALPAFAAAAGVLVLGLVIAFGAMQLRAMGRPSHGPPITLTTATPSASPDMTPTPSPSPTATPTPPAAPPSGAVPQGVPALASIQMVGPSLGWAVGSHAIYTTSDGTHWTKQYSSTETFVGVDFISTTTGWVVGGQSLLGTTDGGRSWHQLGEGRQWIRSVHFVSPSQGWGIAGGNEPLIMHGVLMPSSAGSVVVSTDGGRSWTDLHTPRDPQSVCFSDSGHGWLATLSGTVYRSQNGGQTWSQALQMARSDPGLSGWARVECAAPSALWVQWVPGGAAAGHAPYVVYATTNGQTWRTVMAEAGTIGNAMPGVPAGPGSYPGSFSVVDPSDAVFVGDTPPANAASCMIATGGGATLKSTGQVNGAWQTFDAAFVNTSTGWVLAVDGNGHDVIVRTNDGGYHWSQQLAVAG
ncbi:MAG TPA: YCF48-related protein [Candidatus Dormibacteraeota bacterium]|nr:YCF48-related protein [Candidatus Dormibacteraeota bacterium]